MAMVQATNISDSFESALSCLRHVHDRLIEYPEFERLRITINAECRALREASAAAELFVEGKVVDAEIALLTRVNQQLST